MWPVLANVLRAVEGSGGKTAALHMHETGRDDGQPGHQAHRTNEMRVETTYVKPPRSLKVSANKP